jgi:DNA-binding Lrp family transcriptional regulator
MVSAVVLIKAEIESVNELAAAIADLKGVTQVFSVAGHYDLVALLSVRSNEDVADLVSGQIRKVSGIKATETLIAFRVFTNPELETTYSIGLD